MRILLSYQSLLLGALAVLTACSSGDEMTINTPAPEQAQAWNVRVTATNDSIAEVNDEAGGANRAAFVGGNTDRFMTAWDQGDIVKAYRGTTAIDGQLAPNSSFYGTVTADLEGSLTGPFTANETLTLFSPSKAMDFTGQTGTLQSMSGKTFRTSETTVASALDNILELSAVNMSHRVSYGRFFLTDENGGARLHPSQLEIHAVEGPELVLKVDEDGNAIETGDMVINAVLNEGEYPGEIYVSFYRDYAEAFKWRLKATVGEDIYVGPVEGQNAIASQAAKGRIMNYRRKMRKTTALSSLTIADIPARVFTGSAHEPVLTVTDGEDELTLNTDYSVAYTDNVNVGTATATATGLADAGAVATTKYLGTQAKTFSITQATPVITMPTTDDMTLEVGLTRQRAVSTVTLDNSAYSIADLDILSAPYSCTVSYASDDTSIATVDADGTVHGVATGTTTIRVNVASAANWTAQQATYTVKVSPRVNTSGNSTWTTVEDAENGSLYQ